jgi:hypothetical protein
MTDVVGTNGSPACRRYDGRPAMATLATSSFGTRSGLAESRDS